MKSTCYLQPERTVLNRINSSTYFNLEPGTTFSWIEVKNRKGLNISIRISSQVGVTTKGAVELFYLVMQEPLHTTYDEIMQTSKKFQG